MTLSAAALTTVANVVDELELADSADTKVRARIERYIESASGFVRGLLGRQVHSGTFTVDVAGMDHPTLILPITPITSITSITLRDGDVVDAADYEIENAEAGFVRRIGDVWPSEMRNTAGVVAVGIPGTERRNVRVVYVGGWVTPSQGVSTVPDAVADAVVELVVSRWRRRGRDLNLDSQTLERSSASWGGAPVPPSVLTALSPYMRTAA